MPEQLGCSDMSALYILLMRHCQVQAFSLLHVLLEGWGSLRGMIYKLVLDSVLIQELHNVCVLKLQPCTKELIRLISECCLQQLILLQA